MGIAYTKEFLVDLVLWKYRTTKLSQQEPGKLERILNQHFDAVGKDQFRKHCSITPDLVKLYKLGEKNSLDFLDVACYNVSYE